MLEGAEVGAEVSSSISVGTRDMSSKKSVSLKFESCISSNVLFVSGPTS